MQTEPIQVCVYHYFIIIVGSYKDKRTSLSCEKGILLQFKEDWKLSFNENGYAIDFEKL